MRILGHKSRTLEIGVNNGSLEGPGLKTPVQAEQGTAEAQSTAWEIP
jgi:hypothetical protein